MPNVWLDANFSFSVSFLEQRHIGERGVRPCLDAATGGRASLCSKGTSKVNFAGGLSGSGTMMAMWRKAWAISLP